jgi:hypothetical protein
MLLELIVIGSFNGFIAELGLLTNPRDKKRRSKPRYFPPSIHVDVSKRN